MRRFASTGDGPRHLVISPDGRYLYVTNNASGTVSKVDARTGRVLASVATGNQPRSMAISGDGRAVYVVNYESSTVSKLRASDLGRLGEVATDQHPIGITYEPTTRLGLGRLLRRQHPGLRRHRDGAGPHRDVLTDPHLTAPARGGGDPHSPVI